MQFGRLASRLLGGFLAAIKWNYVYITYGFMLAAFLLVAFLLPRDAPAAKNQDSRRKGEPSGGDRGMGAGGSGLGALKSPGVWQLIVFTLAFGIVQFPVTSHVSLYIEGYGLGQPSMTGTLTALSCALAGVTGFLFAPVYRMTGKRTMPAAFLAVGVGFVAAGLVVSLPTVFFGLALCTVAMAVFVPYTIICAGTVSDRDTAPLLIAAIPALLNLGSFISPQAMDFLSAAFGDGGPVGAYLYAGILAIIAGAVCALRRHAA
jgi:MFS family permease